MNPSVKNVLIRGVLSVVLVILFMAFLAACWGWDDLPGLLAHPARRIAFGLLLLRAAALAWFPKAARRCDGVPGKSVGERCFLTPLMAAALLSLCSPYFDRRGFLTLRPEEVLRYVGLVLFGGGLVLASWAQWHMGRLFSGYLIIQPGHQLIQDGPFAWMRHPRYAGLMLVFIGWPLVFVSLCGFLAGLVCTAMFLTRIPREEALLAREFSEEWQAYARRTSRLLPGIY